MTPLYVTRPQLPSLEDLQPLLEDIWSSRVLTNGGKYHQRFEAALADHLGVRHVSLFTNATIALVTALQALRVTGEVITTPYSFVATAHSLLWNGIRPIFVDIDEESLNIDPARIEAAITPQTTAILAVHCYGRPCNVDALQKIADTYGLKLIYDAAHAFGVCDTGGSLLRHGDLSIVSFHATKVMNTFEGGAIICPDRKTKERIDHLKNFGFVDEVTVVAPGINGKMNELQSAIGLLQLAHIDDAISARQRVSIRYREELSRVGGLRLLTEDPAIKSNHAYFPVLIERDFWCGRDALYEHLKRFNVFARRYFYPLITTFPMYRGFPSSARANLPVATRKADQILCLPLYPELSTHDQDRVIAAVKGDDT
ncbi:MULTISPECIES: DegT/DnrJ/EryC1/StrS family aminotransferase [unclassified Variovorax]|uniref:DegT/DnrJ/EryC1/StrS family aminotransferase n=1 Tax=unclassified Variovorax TaxID=663243 RepID=UPI00076DB0DC|nr:MULTISPECIES: DegT/DnrJ/EryC1/StrS family aminotransferase [unclassified Variovorax]KWT85754.1 Aminotransferase, DegT/DnrJ/EryC1/StrS family [Variovorax sp. WDL1]PNG58382.1 dTDP-4-amino-4,6-dideoxy-D-glucose transaminase [Variovorax sp. B4]PNG61828.1 dTDP-4-amino-4,6-dideoxy-D-glucose transaminase [Variovorax sp. B2]VTV12109.1 UDP-4-amino-4-deoxy-L-arabinose--oxoglutarate aminotransferase [Variovorax sp. WDL1]